MAARKRTKTFPQACWSTCGGTKMHKNVPSAVLERVWRYENGTRFQASVGEGIYFLNRRFAPPPTASVGPLPLIWPRVAIGSGNTYLLLERA